MSAKGKGRLERIRRAIHRHREGKSSQAVTGCHDSISDQARDEYSVDMRRVRLLREKLERAKRWKKRKAAVVKVIERTVVKLGGDQLAGVARRIGEAFRDKGPVTSEEVPLLWDYRQGNSTRKTLKKGAAGKETEDERKDDDKRRGKGKGRHEEEEETRKEMPKKREEKEAKREKKDEEKRRKREEEKSRTAEEAQIRSEMRQRVSLAQIFF